MNYRPELDGLRAIAVLPVILYHAGFAQFSGGYIGVDVFFVISGYLITSLIREELRTNTFTLKNFYERRARRILPALFLVIACTFPFAWLWLQPPELLEYLRSVVATLGFSSNFLFWFETGYFETAVELKPLIHTWSLAVEEQYYIIFPLLLIIFKHLRVTLQFGLLIMLALVSLYLTFQIGAIDQAANFFLLPSRLWELMLGSMLAYLLACDIEASSFIGRLNQGAKAQVLSVLGLLLIMGSVFAFDKNTLHPGVITLVPTLGTCLIIFTAAKGTLVYRLLANRYLVGLGLISYSAYLWHQPLFAFARIRSIAEPTAELMLLLSVSSLGLAWLSYRYVETPIRRGTIINRTVLMQGIGAFCFVAVGLVLSGHINKGYPSRFETQELAINNGAALSQRVQVNYGLDSRCDTNFTLSPHCRTSNTPEILVWGDSYAMHLVDGVHASNPSAGLIQLTMTSCGPLLGIAPVNFKRYTEQWAGHCLEFGYKVKRWIEQNDTVRYAVLSSPFAAYMSDSWSLLTEEGVVKADMELALKHFSETLAFLEANNIKPVIVSPPPSSGTDLGKCLVKAVQFSQPLEICDYDRKLHDKRQGKVKDFLKTIDQDHHVLWLDQLLCDDKTCRAGMDGVFLYRDKGHLSREGSAYIGKLTNFYALISQP